MDAFEHFVDSSVVMPVGSPAFDDAVVIAIDENMLVCSSGASNRLDEEFKTDGFCPGNVSFAVSALPVGAETAGPPSLAKDDADADAETSASI